MTINQVWGKTAVRGKVGARKAMDFLPREATRCQSENRKQTLARPRWLINSHVAQTRRASAFIKAIDALKK